MLNPFGRVPFTQHVSAFVEHSTPACFPLHGDLRLATLKQLTILSVCCVSKMENSR